MMAWIKLDDQWMDHPKMIAAGRDARDMWLASLTWCAKHLTDGYFHKNLLHSLASTAGVDVANCQEFASILLDVGLWDATENGYYVHDYLEYNPSKQDVIDTKEARKEAGRAGGIAKASKTPSKMLAKPKQNPAPSPSPSPSPNPEVVDDDLPSSPLEAAFVGATKMNGLLPSPEKAFQAYKIMQEAGVEPQDLINAIHILMQKKYTIVGPSSVVNTAINEMSQRLQSSQTNFRKRPGMMPDGV